MTVYLDVIFLENILMNYIILAATVVITKNQTKHNQLRLIFASIIGSTYAILLYLKVFKIYETFFAKIILSIIIVFVALNPKSVKELLKRILTFYLVSFVFGGCTVALMYLINPNKIILKNGVFVGTYPIKVAIIAGAIAFIVVQIVFKINKAKVTAKDIIYTIEISMHNKKTKVKALLDTGNMLKDPITNVPVIVVEEKIMKKVIPSKFFEVGIGGDESEEIEMYKTRIRMIPFSSIGKENGMLMGIKVDNVKVIDYDGTKEIKNVIVGIYKKNLSKNDKYNALIGLNLLEKENK